jgi:CRP/FNR family transcriptional regulator, nitrogen oxide reductase regulator
MGQTAFNNFGFNPEGRTPRPYLASTAAGVAAPAEGSSNQALKRRVAAVQRFEVFQDLSSEQCCAIVAAAHEKQFWQRHTIFFEGDPARHVILLLSGCLKITQLGANGQEVILRLNRPGDMLGGIGRSSDSELCTTARTTQPSTLLVWETDRFEALLEQFPFLRRNLTHVLEHQLNELEIRFREVSTEKVSPRLSSLLLRLLNQVGKRCEAHVEISLSRRELAQLTGTTLFTVSRLLCQWEAQGILSARREAVLVLDIPALTEVSQIE